MKLTLLFKYDIARPGGVEMIGLELQMTCVQEQAVSGGASKKMFVRAERLLRDTEYQKALQYVASRKKMSSYASMVDFLFCELVVGYRGKCQKYYNDTGPPLRKMSECTKQQVAIWDTFLVKSLQIAHEIMDQEREKSWCKFRSLALPHLAAAA